MSKTTSKRVTVAYLLVLILVSLLGIRPTGATVFVKTDMQVLASRADLVVVGLVESATARWAGGQIVTDALVRVEDWVKGRAGRIVRVVQPGGKVGDVVMRVLGGAEFRTGDRAILFLARAGDVHRVVGLARGKLDVGPGNLVRWTTGPIPLRNALGELRRTR